MAEQFGDAPVVWVQQKTLDALAAAGKGASSFQIANTRFAAWEIPLYAHPPTVEVREPDAELVKALSGLVTAVGKMRVPQNVSDVALLVMVTLGPALSHAQDILSKHGGNDA